MYLLFLKETQYWSNFFLMNARFSFTQTSCHFPRAFIQFGTKNLFQSVTYDIKQFLNYEVQLNINFIHTHIKLSCALNGRLFANKWRGSAEPITQGALRVE